MPAGGCATVNESVFATLKPYCAAALSNVAPCADAERSKPSALRMASVTRRSWISDCLMPSRHLVDRPHGRRGALLQTAYDVVLVIRDHGADGTGLGCEGETRHGGEVSQAGNGEALGKRLRGAQLETVLLRRRREIIRRGCALLYFARPGRQRVLCRRARG